MLLSVVRLCRSLLGPISDARSYFSTHRDPADRYGLPLRIICALRACFAQEQEKVSLSMKQKLEVDILPTVKVRKKSATIRSIHDPEVQLVLNQHEKKYHPSPPAWEDQILYFLLPDRFSDGREAGFFDNGGNLTSGGGTPLYEPKDRDNAIQDELSRNTWVDAGAKFVGGNLKGLASKLGYLKRLGVTALWVGPVFKQVRSLETYHGYAVQNFLDIDPRLGSRRDLKELVKAAHKLGIYIILDIVLNHSGNVFSYKKCSPVYSGREYEVAGYYDADRRANIPMGKVDLGTHPHAFPDGAVWPAELQPATCFTRKGRIGNNSNHWDTAPEYLDGDFYDLKDLALGCDDPAYFSPTPALNTLCQIYKYWIAYADLDGFRIDTVKHMGIGPTRYFASAIHEYTQTLGKNRFLLIGEIAGNHAFKTVEATGIDAALGIGGLQEQLWKIPKGLASPATYFGHFCNARHLKEGSQTWLLDKIVTMIDDHDQIWRSAGTKGRFCSDNDGPKLVLAAIGLDLCTMGIPCIYYGTEQSFDGQGSTDSVGHLDDQYIRESMFGGNFGAFRSRGKHFFDESMALFKAIGHIAAIRRKEIALRRGRQYLREISGNGRDFGYPAPIGCGKMRSVVAWSRIFDTIEVLCAINTDPDKERIAFVTIDQQLHQEGDFMRSLFSSNGLTLKVEQMSEGRLAVQLKLRPAEFVIYK